MRYGSYTTLDKGQPWILRGTHQQTNNGLLWQPPSYKSWPAGGGAAVTHYGPGLGVGYFALHNRSASPGVHGIGVRIPNELWKFGQWTDATTTYVDDTADAQNTTDADVDLETTTNNDGYVVLSRVPFNAISLNIATASSGGTAARAIRFSNLAGTGWQTAESNTFIAPKTGGDYATGESVVAFATPIDWGKSSSLATDLPDGYYAANVRATTAPSSTAGVAASVEIFHMYFLTEGLSDNATLLEEFTGREMTILEHEGRMYGDALVALFETANDQNRATIQVRAI
jgi:hypothetical protein